MVTRKHYGSPFDVFATLQCFARTPVSQMSGFNTSALVFVERLGYEGCTLD